MVLSTSFFNFVNLIIIMREFIYRIIALLAAMVFGATAQATETKSLAELSGEDYCISCAYAEVVLELPAGQAYDYRKFQEWVSKVYAPSVGMVYDGTAAGNIAILHAKPLPKAMPVASEVEIAPVAPVQYAVPMTEVEYSGNYAIYTTKVGTDVQVDSVANYPTVHMEYRELDAVTVVEVVREESVADAPVVKRKFVRADVGQSIAMTLTEAYVEYYGRGRESDRKWKWIWRSMQRSGIMLHPADAMSHDLTIREHESYVKLYEFLGRYSNPYWAWQWLDSCPEMVALWVEYHGNNIVVLPPYEAGGGVVKPIGNGLHKVNAAKSRRACSKGDKS